MLTSCCLEAMSSHVASLEIQTSALMKPLYQEEIIACDTQQDQRAGLKLEHCSSGSSM